MKRIIIGLILVSASPLFAQVDSIAWKQYAQGGMANSDSLSGGFGYYRLNRQTEKTFRDLRLFAYGLKKDSFIYLRYKTSDKYTTRPRFYRYTITSYRKNTRANVALQYHFNQGFGLFINQYEDGLINAELGHAFDMSDYLNETRKTSYIKTGAFWDHDTNQFSTKLELEYFKQISEVVENDLSRIQYMLEVIVPIKAGLSFNMNYEMEDYMGKSLTDASSLTFAIGWQGNLKWTF
ncbi:MAG: hypothetical protein OXU46_08025 [Candidatus Marinimicrobia bacterium]|nr:hypothetical protein [Candidatus Neomarinimicrobiota bacterium]